MRMPVIILSLVTFFFVGCSISNGNKYYSFEGSTNSTLGWIYTKSVLSIKPDSSSVLNDFYSDRKGDSKKSIYYKIDQFRGRVFILKDTLYFKGNSGDYSNELVFYIKDKKRIILLDHHKRYLQKWRLNSN